MIEIRSLYIAYVLHIGHDTMHSPQEFFLLCVFK